MTRRLIFICYFFLKTVLLLAMQNTISAAIKNVNQASIPRFRFLDDPLKGVKCAIISLMNSPSDSQISANRQIARAAGTVMIAYVLSSVVSLARGMVILRTFGTAADMEAFNAANRVAETLYNLVAGGALASAFVPTFTGLLTKNNRKEAWKLASAIMNLVLILISVLAMITAFFAPQIVRYLLAPGFVEDPQKFQLTVQLLRIILPSTVIFGLSGLLMGVLNAHQSFLFPALAPSMYSLGMIFGVLVLSPSMGIFGLAWGVVIGAAAHLIIQLPKLFSLKGNYFPQLGLKNKEVQEVGLLMVPRLVGTAVVQLNFWVNTNLASRYPEGSVTALTYGFTLMMMPLLFIAQAIATASLPTFSAQVALGKLDEMRASLAASLRAVLLLSIPASVGLMILRVPIIQLLYQNGDAFDSRSTSLVAWALLWYAAGLVGHSIVEIVSRAFYALHDTRTPVTIGVAAMTLNIILSLLLGWLFEQIGWMPHGGLALANSIATGLESIVLLFLMRKRLNGLQGKRIFSALWRALVAVTFMGSAVYLLISEFNTIPDIYLVAGGAFVGIIIYMVLISLLKVQELSQLVQAILSRIPGRFLKK